MALIAKNDKQIVLCAHREIIVYTMEQKTHTRTSVPVILKKEEKHVADDEKNELANKIEPDNEDKECKTNGKTANGQISHLAVSSCGNLLAVTTFGDKFLHIYKLNHNDESLDLFSRHELARGPSAIRFSADSKLLLVADKTGDCFVFDCAAASNDSGKWILGHFSMVLDILMTADAKFIITSDRDEKIRVTRYPQTELIETYCLGHVEFVSAIELISLASNDTLLLSLSGDKTLRLWNYIDGIALFRLELPAPGLRLIKNKKNQLAVVLLDETIKIAIYEVHLSAIEYKISKLAEHTFGDDVKHINSLVFESDEQILVSCHTENEEILLNSLLLQTISDETMFIERTSDHLMSILKKNVSSTKISALEDVSILFKKKFDNLKDYHEKKKRRIEDKMTK